MDQPPPQPTGKAIQGELAALLEAADVASTERCWSRFLEAHSDLVMAVAKSLGRGHDEVMDRYTYALDALRKDDFRRLRTYAAGSAARFEVWLVAVVRRLCVDYHRTKYGRYKSDEDEHPHARADAVARKHLVDFIMQDIDVTPVPTSGGSDPEWSLRRKELRQLLELEITGLTEADQLLLKLRFQDQVPVREIATVMSLPSVFHVYRRLKAVLKQLRAGLERRGVEDIEP